MTPVELSLRNLRSMMSSKTVASRQRVAADVKAVLLVLIRHAGEVRGVVRRGRHLGAAADAARGVPVGDDALDVAVGGVAGVGEGVEAERLARLQDRAVDLLGRARLMLRPESAANPPVETRRSRR